jgi:hypothetical protein
VPIPIDQLYDAPSASEAAKEAVSSIDLDSAFDTFASPTLAHLRSVTDEMANRSGRFVHARVDQWLAAIRLPFEGDRVRDSAGRVVISEIMDPRSFFVFAVADLRLLNAYHAKDSLCSFDQSDVDAVIATLGRSLPVVPNVPPADRIVAGDCLSGCCFRSLERPRGMREVELFEVRDPRGAPAAPGVLGAMLAAATGRLPLKLNIAAAAAVRAISSRFAPECGARDVVPPPETAVFDCFSVKDCEIYGLFEAKARRAQWPTVWPLAANLPVAAVIDGIASPVDFVDFAQCAMPVRHAFQVRGRVQFSSDEVRCSLSDAIPLPVAANALSARELLAIADRHELFELGTLIVGFQQRISHFELNDAQAYTVIVAVTCLIELLLAELDSSVPLTSKALPDTAF